MKHRSSEIPLPQKILDQEVANIYIVKLLLRKAMFLIDHSIIHNMLKNWELHKFIISICSFMKGDISKKGLFNWLFFACTSSNWNYKLTLKNPKCQMAENKKERYLQMGYCLMVMMLRRNFYKLDAFYSQKGSDKTVQIHPKLHFHLRLAQDFYLKRCPLSGNIRILCFLDNYFHN